MDLTKLTKMLKTSDPLYIWPVSFSILASLSAITLLIAIYSQLPNQLPLFYSLGWGEQQLVSKQQFFLLPALVLFTTLLNSFIAWHIHPSQVVLKRVLVGSVVLISLIGIITALKVITIFI